MHFFYLINGIFLIYNNMENKVYKPVGIIKKFSKKLHKKYDIPARKAIMDVLGDFIIENPDEYGQDFLINNDKYKSHYKYLEVQVCACWHDKYPYDSFTVYERKLRYGNDTLFLTMNNDLTKGYLFDLKYIRNNKPKRLKKYSRQFVYDVPWYQLIPVCIQTLDIETMESI